MSRIPALTRLLIALLVAVLGCCVLQAPSASAATRRTVTAKPVSSTVTLGKFLVFNGKVSRTPRKKLVYLQRRIGTKWVKVTATYTRPGGAWTMVLAAPKAVGNYTYRAYAPRQGVLAAAASPRVPVTVLRSTSVTMTPDDTTVDAGSAVAFSGTVTPFVAGAPVQVQKLEGTTWTVAATTTVSGTGTYQKAVFNPAATTYRIVVPRAGFNAAATSSSVTVYTRPAIATEALPDALQDTAYSFQLTAGGNATGGWAATGLPAGLTLAEGSDTITGKATQLGDFPVTISFLSGGVAATPKTLTLHVGLPPAPVIATETLPDGKGGAAYTGAVALQTVVPGTWSATGLPTGLSLNPQTGAITGTPDGLTYLFTTTVTPTFTFTRPGTGQSVSKPLPIKVVGSIA